MFKDDQFRQFYPGFDVEIYTDMTGKQMNDLKHQFTEETRHRDANCFLILIIRYLG